MADDKTPKTGGNMPEAPKSEEKLDKGPKLGSAKELLPATYKTARGNTREDR